MNPTRGDLPLAMPYLSYRLACSSGLRFWHGVGASLAIASRFALSFVVVLATPHAAINWKWLDNVNMRQKGFWGTSTCLRLQMSNPGIYSDIRAHLRI